MFVYIWMIQPWDITLDSYPNLQTKINQGQVKGEGCSSNK